MSDDNRPLIIACGALVSELREVLNINGLNEAVEVRYLPANLHNRPEGIVPALREHLDGRGKRPTMVGYADCGTGGALDRMLESYPDVQRLPGAHCYEFYASSAVFHALSDAEPGTFYLTDFLAKHFDRLVVTDLKLDKHPELEPQLFGHYRKVVYLAQVHDDTLRASAARAAERLGLPLEIIETGYGQLASSLQEQVVRMIP